MIISGDMGRHELPTEYDGPLSAAIIDMVNDAEFGIFYPTLIVTDSPGPSCLQHCNALCTPLWRHAAAAASCADGPPERRQRFPAASRAPQPPTPA